MIRSISGSYLLSPVLTHSHCHQLHPAGVFMGPFPHLPAHTANNPCITLRLCSAPGCGSCIWPENPREPSRPRNLSPSYLTECDRRLLLWQIEIAPPPYYFSRLTTIIIQQKYVT